jgi:hypothetical protein
MSAKHNLFGHAGKRTIVAMRDASYIVAFFGGLFLIAAAAAWWRIVREHEKRSSSAQIVLDFRRLKSASIATVIAFGLCGVAAILAVLGWFLRG